MFRTRLVIALIVSFITICVIYLIFEIIWIITPIDSYLRPYWNGFILICWCVLFVGAYRSQDKLLVLQVNSKANQTD